MFENYEYRQDYVDNLLGRLLSTSILTVLLVLLLGVFEIIFFRRFFLYKKLIWRIIIIYELKILYILMNIDNSYF
jgi:hypothetical protein